MVLDLAALLSLNNFFHSHFQTPWFLTLIIFNFLSFVTNKPVTFENINQLSQDFSGIRSNSILQITSFLRSTKNLIKNPCGALKFDHWSVIRGCNNWTIEDFQVYKSMKTIFVSSFECGSLTQK